MKKNTDKTNVMRILEQKKIPYTSYDYTDTGVISGSEVAAVLNQDPRQVFKTLVTVGHSGENYVFLVPVEEELNLKKAAKSVGEKSISMIKSKELLALTGYIHGGCSPIGMKKQFKTVIDASAENFDTIIFSGGKIGYQVEVSLDALKKVLKFTLEEVADAYTRAKSEFVEKYTRGARIVRLVDCPKLKEQVAQWFHEKWGIPLEAYQESMEECLTNKSSVPQWYLAMEGERIVGGMGVIENDFHDRKDLAPNVCAVYTEPDRRCNGIAGKLLHFVCADMKKKGIDTLYLVTDHTSFYERYGWEFLCMVQGDGEPELTRMYVHREQ